MRATLLRSLIISAVLVAFGTATTTYAADSATTVTCKDGTSSKGGKGACSHHGGVQKGAASAAASTAAPATAAAAPAPTKPAASHSKAASSASSASNGAAAPGAATAKCKDGTMSLSKHHAGACSHHGGVAEWLDNK
jgi:hypothetical protein